ncbi:MAG: helix-turn-helix domain-containing protein [Chloroflexota bacterium]|jgi:excisionase family DNA binding protein
MPEEVLTVQEVAAMLKTTPATVYAWCRAGKLPAFKIGQQWRIRARALEEMMRRGYLPELNGQDGREQTE